MGEAGHLNGVRYVNSECGLFPLPLLESRLELESLGMVTARCLLDNRHFDVDFSPAFYKSLMRKNMAAQTLNLVDLRDVAPHIFEFASSLVDVLRVKRVVEINCRSEKKRRKILMKIKCDGVSFDDLCVNFTLPGFPDVEMMEGGADTFLSIDNVEEYLKQLVWMLLHKGPQNSTEDICRGMKRIIDIEDLKILLPKDIEEAMSGKRMEQWSIEDLETYCVLKYELTTQTAVVRDLFEVLSSLSAEERQRFLYFVTSSPRLPFEGLRSLNPKMTINCHNQLENPDAYLPTAMTCFNTLVIYNYTSKEILREQLLLAIREGSSSFQFV